MGMDLVEEAIHMNIHTHTSNIYVNIPMSICILSI
jgi:hypothetical protein